MPPDEFHKLVNDSAYTNSVARIALRFAVKAAAIVGPDVSKGRNVAHWADVAEHLFVPFEEDGEAGGWHPEYDGYTKDVTIKQGDGESVRQEARGGGQKEAAGVRVGEWARVQAKEHRKALALIFITRICAW